MYQKFFWRITCGSLLPIIDEVQTGHSSSSRSSSLRSLISAMVAIAMDLFRAGQNWFLSLSLAFLDQSHHIYDVLVHRMIKLENYKRFAAWNLDLVAKFWIKISRTLTYTLIHFQVNQWLCTFILQQNELEAARIIFVYSVSSARLISWNI